MSKQYLLKILNLLEWYCALYKSVFASFCYLLDFKIIFSPIHLHLFYVEIYIIVKYFFYNELKLNKFVMAKTIWPIHYVYVCYRVIDDVFCLWLFCTILFDGMNSLKWLHKFMAIIYLESYFKPCDVTRIKASSSWSCNPTNNIKKKSRIILSHLVNVNDLLNKNRNSMGKYQASFFFKSHSIVSWCLQLIFVNCNQMK